MTDHSDPRTEPASPTEPRRTTAPGTTRESAAGAGTSREPTAGAAASRDSATRTGRTPGVTRDSASKDGLTPEPAQDVPAGTTAGDGRDLSVKSGARADLGAPVSPRKAADGPAHERTGHHKDRDTDQPLVSRDEQDKLSQRMQQAVTDFVESPRRAVEEADSTFDQIVSGLTEALTERRRVLRASWQEQDTEAQTEELRIALQRYRDLSEQLLKM